MAEARMWAGRILQCCGVARVYAGVKPRTHARVLR